MTDNTDNKAAAEQKQKQDEAARKRVADERAANEKRVAEKIADDGKVKPTPTQEENDLAAQGVHVLEHEPDGSPEQPPGVGAPKTDEQRRHEATRQSELRPSSETRQSERQPQPQRGSYQTRTQTPDKQNE